MIPISIPTCLDSFALSVLADPVSKQSVTPDSFTQNNGILDARVFLKSTHAYMEWAKAQHKCEAWKVSGVSDQRRKESFLAEIAYDRPIYEHYSLNGAVLDVGGGVGTVREFFPEKVQFISIDPHINAVHEIDPAKCDAYSCLTRPLNFIAATAEFLPFMAESFNWVHMRSMLDHVHVPDLALLEARRVLKTDGRVLIGLYVEGGRSGIISSKQCIKKIAKKALELVGIDRWKDYHMWHPTYKSLIKLIEDNGLAVEDVFWQPHWHEQVCYVCARKT